MVTKAREGALVLGMGGSITVCVACKGNLSGWYLSCGCIYVLVARSLLTRIRLVVPLSPWDNFFDITTNHGKDIIF
jgi:hypothetical protein